MSNILNLGKDLYIKGRIGWKGLKKEEYLDSGDFKIINATALEDGYIDWDNCGFITKERYEESPEIMLQEDDILISKDGTLGKIGYVKNMKTPCSVASGIFVLRNSSKEKVNFDYLYHLLTSHIFKDFIKRNKAEGSTINHLYQRDLENFEINLPDLEVQEKVAFVLNSIDRKIQNNNKQIQTLESLAKTIYDYWFVQFDFPNEDGEPYKSSGGKMVWNEELKREIPEGWKYTFIGSITNCYDSKRVPLSSKQRGAKKGEFPYYGATCVMDYVNEFIFDGDYVLMAEDGSIMKVDNTPILQRITGKTWVNNHAHILEPKKGYSCAVLMQLLKDIYVPSLKTGSIQAKITQEKMNSIKIIDIPSDLLYEINKQLLPLDSKVLHLQNEISVLNKLKGFILPLLMNGQVSVNV